MDANKRELMAKMDASQEEMKATIRSGQEEIIKGITGACRESTEVYLEKTKALPETTEACPVKTRACLEKKEPTPEETEAVEEPQEVPEGATGEETIGAAKDRSRDLRLAVGCRGHLKTRTKRDGRVRQECAATVGRPTRRFVPALRKGPGMKCRGSGTKGRGIAAGSRMRGMIRKRQRGLEKRKTFYNAIEPTLGLEIIKLVVESSIGLREPGDGTLWKCRPPPKRKR
jgi:hypothetical protein